MKNLTLSMVFILIGVLCTAYAPKPNQEVKPGLTGAWKTTFTENGKEVTGILIFTDNYFSETYFSNSDKNFNYTKGGAWKAQGSQIVQNIEYNTKDSAEVGSALKKSMKFSSKKVSFTYNDKTWSNIDNGQPGELEGAWLITGRERDGKMNETTPGVRRTMKILSGTRFQWIAYNVETKEFFGTGGGTYVTEGGNYIETIEFFSRDASRVGMSLEFEYDLKNGKWHHKGFSSKGDPIYEVWTKRSELGI